MTCCRCFRRSTEDNQTDLRLEANEADANRRSNERFSSGVNRGGEKGAVRNNNRCGSDRHDRGNDRPRRLHRLVWRSRQIAPMTRELDDFPWWDLRSRVAGKTRADRETSRRLPLHSAVRSLARTIEAFARYITIASWVAYRHKI